MKKIISRFLLKLFGERAYSKLRFFYNHKRFPNLDMPITFSEKLLYDKLNNITPLHTICADKYSVRSHVKKRVGDRFLINLIAKFDDVNEFISAFDKLPNQFALKASHGSGWNEIVFDKDSVNRDKLFKNVKRWLNDNYYYYGCEKQYRDIKPAIVVEDLLVDIEGKVPNDYKFYCFGKSGKKRIIIQVDLDRFGNHERVFYDENWVKSNISILSSKSKFSTSNLPKPECLDTMLYLAKELSADFSFSRIDLYEHKGNVFFGEITFHPESAYGIYISPVSEEVDLGLLL